MGCVVMYMRSQTTNRLKPVWLRSKDQGNRWIQGQISINKTSSYQVGFKIFVYIVMTRVWWATPKLNFRCHSLYVNGFYIFQTLVPHEIYNAGDQP